MIPEAAVEAALRAYGLDHGEPLDWERKMIVNILAAAAPHMKADAWDEGCEAMHATTGGEWAPIHEDNPYRSQE